MNTWRRLNNGAWGVSVEGPVSAGDIVEVCKRSGETSLVTVVRVLGTRKDGSASLCTVAKGASSRPRNRRPVRSEPDWFDLAAEDRMAELAGVA